MVTNFSISISAGDASVFISDYIRRQLMNSDNKDYQNGNIRIIRNLSEKNVRIEFIYCTEKLPTIIMDFDKIYNESCLAAIELEKERILKENRFKEYMNMVRLDGMNLDKIPIEDRTEELILTAIRQNGFAIKYVSENKLKDEFILEAVRNNGMVLELIKNQTEDICIESVKQNWKYLKFVKDECRTAAVFKAATIQSKGSDEFIKYLSNMIYTEAVKQNPKNIAKIPRDCITAEMANIAILDDGLNIKYVDKKLRTKDMCMDAVENNINAFDYLSETELTSDICFEVVKENARKYFYLIPDRLKVHRIIEIALQQDGMILQYVKNKANKRECSIAVEQNPLAIEYVPNKFKTPKMCNKASEKDYRTLRYIPTLKQTENMVINSIKNNKIIGQDICIKIESHLVYETLVKKDGMLLKAIPVRNRTVDLCEFAVDNNPYAIRYTKKNQSESMCLKAVKYDPILLRYVSNPTEEMIHILENYIVKNDLGSDNSIKNVLRNAKHKMKK